MNKGTYTFSPLHKMNAFTAQVKTNGLKTRSERANGQRMHSERIERAKTHSPRVRPFGTHLNAFVSPWEGLAIFSIRIRLI